MYTKQCKYCQLSFSTTDKRKRYCNSKCFGATRKVIRNCQQCNGNLLKSQNKFCSRTCAGQFRSLEIVKDWQQGKASGSDSNGQLREPLRRFLLEEAEWKCTRCSWGVPNPVTGKPILTIDHIDGNWSNNTVENLRVLCYNCHTLTETFGALNIGNPGNTQQRPGTLNRYKQGPIV